MEYFYTKDINAAWFVELIRDTALKDLFVNINVSRNADGSLPENNVKVTFTQILESSEEDILINLINNYNPYKQIIRDILEVNDEKIYNLAVNFAADNSLIMMALGWDTAQKAAEVRKVVDLFKPIDLELKMYSYYDVFAMLDNIPRSEPLMTDTRINTYKAELAEIIS